MNEEISQAMSLPVKIYVRKAKSESLDGKEKRTPIEVNVKSKSYNVQSPSTIVPLNSPVIEEENISKIAARIDICSGTNTYATSETLQELRKFQANRRQNKNLLTVESSIALLKKVYGY